MQYINEHTQYIPLKRHKFGTSCTNFIKNDPITFSLFRLHLPYKVMVDFDIIEEPKHILELNFN